MTVRGIVACLNYRAIARLARTSVHTSGHAGGRGLPSGRWLSVTGFPSPLDSNPSASSIPPATPSASPRPSRFRRGRRARSSSRTTGFPAAASPPAGRSLSGDDNPAGPRPQRRPPGRPAATPPPTIANLYSWAFDSRTPPALPGFYREAAPRACSGARESIPARVSKHEYTTKNRAVWAIVTKDGGSHRAT